MYIDFELEKALEKELTSLPLVVWSLLYVRSLSFRNQLTVCFFFVVQSFTSFPRNRSSYLAETDNWGKADGECRKCFLQGLVLRSDLTAFGETCRLGRRFQRSLVPLDRFVFRVRCNFLLALAPMLPVTSASCTFQLRRESHEISLTIDRSTSARFPFTEINEQNFRLFFIPPSPKKKTAIKAASA